MNNSTVRELLLAVKRMRRKNYPGCGKLWFGKKCRRYHRAQKVLDDSRDTRADECAADAYTLKNLESQIEWFKICMGAFELHIASKFRKIHHLTTTQAPCKDGYERGRDRLCKGIFY